MSLCASSSCIVARTRDVSQCQCSNERMNIEWERVKEQKRWRCFLRFSSYFVLLLMNIVENWIMWYVCMCECVWTIYHNNNWSETTMEMNWRGLHASSTFRFEDEVNSNVLTIQLYVLVLLWLDKSLENITRLTSLQSLVLRGFFILYTQTIKRKYLFNFLHSPSRNTRISSTWVFIEHSQY